MVITNSCATYVVARAVGPGEGNSSSALGQLAAGGVGGLACLASLGPVAMPKARREESEGLACDALLLHTPRDDSCMAS